MIFYQLIISGQQFEMKVWKKIQTALKWITTKNLQCYCNIWALTEWVFKIQKHGRQEHIYVLEN